MSSEGENNTIYISPGRAIIQGFHYFLDDTKALAVSSNPDGSSSRIDSVVLRLNRSTNTVTVAVVEGTPAATPAEPALDTTAPVRELRLANLIVTAGTQAVDPAGVLDRRPFIGKRIHTTTNPAGLDVGSIAFNPDNGSFYGVKTPGAATELGLTSDEVTAIADASAANAVGDHVASSDPHSVYLNSARGDARYSLTSHTHAGGPGGVTLCTSTTRPSSPTPGQQIFETDTLVSYIYLSPTWYRTSPFTERIRRIGGVNPMNFTNSGSSEAILTNYSTVYAVGMLAHNNGLQISTAGTYNLSFSCYVVPPTKGVISARIRLNGGSTIIMSTTDSGDDTMTTTARHHLGVSTDYVFAASDTIQVALVAEVGTGAWMLYDFMLCAHRIA